MHCSQREWQLQQLERFWDVEGWMKQQQPQLGISQQRQQQKEGAYRGAFGSERQSGTEGEMMAVACTGCKKTV